MEIIEHITILVEKINNQPVRTVRSINFPKLVIPSNITSTEDIVKYWKNEYNLK